MSYSDVARDAGCSPHTIRRYLQTLEITFQAFRLNPYHPNVSKRLVKAPKVFFADTGVLQSLAQGGISSGALYETFVFSELLKWRTLLAEEVRLLFYRTSAGMEIDFILEGRRGLLPIEVKGVVQVHPADARSLVRFLSEYPNRAEFGLVVYRGREVKELAPRVYAVPDWVLLG